MLIQVMANRFMDFEVLFKHSPVKREKYAAVLSILIKEFENRFQDCQKIMNLLLYLQLHFQLT